MSITMPQMRLWSRYENVCPNLTPEQAYTNKILYKNNILKHKSNSTPLTKKQNYANLSKRVGNRIQKCSPKPSGEITVGMSPDLVILYSRKSDSSYYPRTKRTMHVAGTNWPNGSKITTLPHSCRALYVAKELTERETDA
jgi:hypothetical protein|uniref:Uncharacterized protein n=1 Tax=viral metagenome TaxID=1070528 RepID=A0A6C0IKQ0_9ZZZZ